MHFCMVGRSPGSELLAMHGHTDRLRLRSLSPCLAASFSAVPTYHLPARSLATLPGIGVLASPRLQRRQGFSPRGRYRAFCTARHELCIRANYRRPYYILGGGTYVCRRPWLRLGWRAQLGLAL